MDSSRDVEPVAERVLESLALAIADEVWAGEIEPVASDPAGTAAEGQAAGLLVVEGGAPVRTALPV